LSPNSDNQSPSWKPRQPSTAPYVYTSIRDIEADTSVNVFGVVKFERPVTRTRLEPTDWGWKAEANQFIPVMNEMNASPDSLLKVVHCNCSTQRCTCRTYGLPCTSAFMWPGSVDDSTVFDHSRIGAVLEMTAPDGYLVGDGGYPCRRYLLTPVATPANDAERKYNEAHTSAWNSIERANSILKRRFPALKYGLRLKLKHTLPVIVAAVVVNNLALIAGEEEPPADEELGQFIERLRQDGHQVHFDPVEVGPPTGQLSAATTSMRTAIISSHFN